MEHQPDPGLNPGLAARVELTVTDADTAQALGSGDVPVLGTPRLLALAEAATVAATAARMPGGTTTVGLRVELDHRAPTPVGRTVVADARLAKVDGRRLLFEIIVSDGPVTVAEGRVERMLVDRRRFLQRAMRPQDATHAADAEPDRRDDRGRPQRTACPPAAGRGVPPSAGKAPATIDVETGPAV